MTEQTKRESMIITDHLFCYRDDPLKILYTQENGNPAWLRYVSKPFRDTHFNAREMEMTEAYRELCNENLPENEEVKTSEQCEVIAQGIARIFHNDELTSSLKTYCVNFARNGPPKPKKEPEQKGSAFQSADELKKNQEEQTQKGEIVKSEPERQTPAKRLPAQKPSFEKGSQLALAKALGMNEELADMFFMKIDGKPYIKNPGLLYMAKRQGYKAIQLISEKYDEKSGLWEYETAIYPELKPDQIEAVAKLAPEIQKMAIEALTRPTIQRGSAGRINVQNPRMHPFLKEMAQTRSQNRALRAYTGYGDTSAEEMPTGTIEVD